jgi:hypothetical protein
MSVLFASCFLIQFFTEIRLLETSLAVDRCIRTMHAIGRATDDRYLLLHLSMSITRSRTRLVLFEFACLSQVFALPSRVAVYMRANFVG